MKIRYKAPYNDEVVSFDPGKDIICPLCGDVQSVPPGWQTHTTFVDCYNNKMHSSPDHPEYQHSSLYTDINHFIDDDEPQLTAYRISIGEMFEDDVAEWLQKRTLWHTMSVVGGDPKWLIEPEPWWRRRIKQKVKTE